MGQAPGDLSLSHARGTDKNNIFRGDLILKIRVYLTPAPAVSKRDGHGFFCILLADDVFVQLRDDFPGFQIFHE